MRELCDRHEVLLISTRWPRASAAPGAMFACEHEDVAPDLLCLAKGITGGYLPLAATLATEQIYEGFLGEFEEFRTFFHGHTYTGNPLACAAALATLDVFEEERTLERLRQDRAARRAARAARRAPAVREVRRVGFMVGIELARAAARGAHGHQVTLEARRRGVIIRPLGDVVVLMPPLAIAEADLRRLVEITAEAIEVAASRWTGGGARLWGRVRGCPARSTPAVQGGVREPHAPARGGCLQREPVRGGAPPRSLPPPRPRHRGAASARSRAGAGPTPRRARSPSCARRRPGRTSRWDVLERGPGRDAAVGIALAGS